MASVSREPGRHSWKLSWRQGKKSRAIRIGKMSKKAADGFLARFEELLGVWRGGGVISQDLQAWIDKRPEEIRERLADAGLIEPRVSVTLEELTEAFTASRANVAPATAIRDRQVCDRLIEFFGPARRVESITVRDAEGWRSRLASFGNLREKDRNDLAENTVRRRCGTARQIFAAAIRWKWLRENPFEGMPATVRANLERRVFVSWPDVVQVIGQSACPQFRAILAFVRLTGCRMPSELQGLRWADIDFVARRIVIRSPKTAHHGGEHALRSCPLFPELRPYLEAWRDVAGPGLELPLSSPVFPLVRDAGVNLRTTFDRLIARAGLTAWPKLFTNLRSSREAELLAEFPAADVCLWLGHSLATAARFYSQPLPEVAHRATTVFTVGSGERGGEHAGQKVGNVGNPAGVLSDKVDDAEVSVHKELVTIPDASCGTPAIREKDQKWTVLDSNKRPPRCQRGALTN